MCGKDAAEFRQRLARSHQDRRSLDAIARRVERVQRVAKAPCRPLHCRGLRSQQVVFGLPHIQFRGVVIRFSRRAVPSLHDFDAPAHHRAAFGHRHHDTPTQCARNPRVARQSQPGLDIGFMIYPRCAALEWPRKGVIPMVNRRIFLLGSAVVARHRLKPLSNPSVPA